MKESGPFIGYYGFWVNLTYLSIVSAVLGMVFVLGGNIGYAIICLMVCGVCDMFDGSVAKLAKRNARKIGYGVQIDALADIVSFGVFPVVIGYAIGPNNLFQNYASLETAIFFAVASLYILTALIRLAYFTVVEIELQGKNEKREYYEGMPVTTVAIIIPLAYAICLYFGFSFYAMYNVMLFLISVAFVTRVRVPKLRKRTLSIFILIGLPIIIYLIWNIGVRI